MPLTRLAAASDSGVTWSPDLNASFRSPRLTTSTVLAQRLLKPRLGMRRTSGIVPPWKIGEERHAVVRPLALVAAAGRFAWPEPMPRPSRLRGFAVLVDAAMDVAEIHDKSDLS